MSYRLVDEATFLLVRGAANVFCRRPSDLDGPLHSALPAATVTLGLTSMWYPPPKKKTPHPFRLELLPVRRC